jgi:hypothetical protein
MTECRYCDKIISLDTLNDIWRSEGDGVVTCRANHKKSSYRWTHQPFPLKEVNHNGTIFYVSDKERTNV